MPIINLTEAERYAINEIRSARTAYFPIDGDHAFRAEVLRALMLALPLPELGIVKLSGIGIRLHNATILGQLDLKHGRMPDNAPMPRLALDTCVVEDIILLSHARIEHLCLLNTQMTALVAEYVRINGSLDLRNVRPVKLHALPGAPTIDGACYLNMLGAHIGDGIEAGGAHFVAPAKGFDFDEYSLRYAYAFNLAEATIEGDIRLFPGFIAYGGMNIVGADINGSLLAYGASLTRGQQYAFDGRGANITGLLALSALTPPLDETGRAFIRIGETIRFISEGHVVLHNITIGGDLRMHGAYLRGESSYLYAENITVHGDVELCAASGFKKSPLFESSNPSHLPEVVRFESDQRIDLRSATIKGDLNLKGALLKGKIDLSANEVGGHVLLSPQTHVLHKQMNNGTSGPSSKRFEALNEIKLDGTTLKGNLVLRGAKLWGSLYARGVTVGGLADLSPYEHRKSEIEIWPFDIAGGLSFDNTYISLNLDLSGAKLKGQMQATNLRVCGKLLMCGHIPPSLTFTDMVTFESAQRIDLSSAHISGDVDLTAARLEKGLRFRSGKIDSALIFDLIDTQTSPGEPERQNPDLTSIDLFNAHTNILSDRSNVNHTELAYGNAHFLRLEGFTYSRFSNYRVDDESLSSRELERRQGLARGLIYRSGIINLGTAPSDSQIKGVIEKANKWKSPETNFDFNKRLSWLDLQFRKRKAAKKNYNPDPYNTLYKYYKRMGAQISADRVLYSKLKTERIIGDGLRYIILLPIEKLFGYGLKPLRATFSYLFFVILVASGVSLANLSLKDISNLRPPTLKDITSFKIIDEDKGRLKVIDPPQESFDIKPHTQFDLKRPIRCNQSSNITNIISYTMEMVVPSLDLTEKKYCDFTPESRQLWRTFKLLATILGWIFTPMLVLTWSGLLRRNLEP